MNPQMTLQQILGGKDLITVLARVEFLEPRIPVLVHRPLDGRSHYVVSSLEERLILPAKFLPLTDGNIHPTMRATKVNLQLIETEPRFRAAWVRAGIFG